MIIYHIEVVSSSPVFKDDEQEGSIFKRRTSCLERLNTILLDIFEEQQSFLMQIAEISTPSTILAYVAYTPSGAEKGTIEVETDIQQAWQRLPIQTDITLALIQEITVTDFNRAIQRHEMYDTRVREACTKQFFTDFTKYDYGYKVSDRLAYESTVTNKASAKAAAKKLLPDSSMMQELDRIFCGKHSKKLFFGIPVHYKLSVKADIIADEMIDFLVNCLYLNKRLLSRRITKIDAIEDKRWDKDNISKLFKCSQNSVVEIVLNGDVATEQEYASQYHQISDMLAEYIKEFSGNILFFFVENSSHPGFAKQLLGKIDEELDIIEIQEGVGNARQALAYFLTLLVDSNIQRFFENDVVFEPGKFYSATEVRTKFNQWRKARLKDRVYSAYSYSQTLQIDKAIQKKGSAFDELQSMVGLSEIKIIIKDIIAAYKIQKLRSKYYDSKEAVTRHMIFTGNPGTAKTTVARLLAEILKENGILKTGAFIECGRADLVGKYVGWTAQIVKEKFSQAQGGILFIDEAYSLVEDRGGLYGDEAINTIVQEMENKRGDVIVIFAGYPGKMKEFLAKNEGLRSRIAFHVDFPDYGSDELMGILEKMLLDKQYVMTSQAKAKAQQIFKQVCTRNEFGNGRFVRNLFEQAVNRQATRISESAEEEIGREKLFELQEVDLDVNIVKQYDKEQIRPIGFSS